MPQPCMNIINHIRTAPFPHYGYLPKRIVPTGLSEVEVHVLATDQIYLGVT